jgi:hypothetical protein
MLENCLTPELGQCGISHEIFKQDGAPAHHAFAVQNYHNKIFPNHQIDGCLPTLLWPPHSPDLATCDNAVWEFIKAEFAEHHVVSLDELKQCILEAFDTIIPGVLYQFSCCTLRRIITCRDNGRHTDKFDV